MQDGPDFDPVGSSEYKRRFELFTRIWLENRIRLARRAAKIHKNYNHLDDDADEIYVRVQLELARGRPIPDEKLLNFAYGVAKNVGREGRRQRVHFELNANLAANPWPDIEKAIDAKKKAAITQTAIAQLTPRERQIIDLVQAGHRSKQIGQILGMSQTAVNAARSRLRAKLRHLLDPKRSEGPAPGGCGHGLPKA